MTWAPSRRPREKYFQTPGTPVFVGEKRHTESWLDLFVYNITEVREINRATLDDCRSAYARTPGSAGVLWINVSAIHDVTLIEALGQEFNLHPLTMEDITNTNHRPKWEEFPAYAFLALKMLSCDRDGLRIEHISLILGDHFVLSFLEDSGDVFDSVRDRLRRAAGRVRSLGGDYLAFCLVDAVIDHYFLALESISDRVEQFENRLLSDAQRVGLGELYGLRRELMGVRHAVWPLREALSAINRTEMPLLEHRNLVFWRDLYDHTVQAIDRVESARETLASLHDIYLSYLSNRMNEVMKVLTIISTIFIPLTFIAGIYGMNFDNMPELRWKEGYFIILGVMVLIALSLVLYFRRQRWI